MSSISKRRREGSRTKIKSMGDHKEFLNRITKTLYYGQLPSLPCLSLPVTEISCEVWSMAQRGRSLRRLHADAAAGVARAACVSPCALVLAMLYLERLRAASPDYLANTPPDHLFLVSLMVSNKFLQDDGEDEEVLCSEWAASGGLELRQLKQLEVEFLNAMDWNIFVSDKRFEEGLHWLERRVALKQARLQGFFTYTDLAVTCDRALAAELARSLAAACGGAALACLAGLLALVTSALVISHACMPALQRLAAAPPALDTDITTHTPLPALALPQYVPNTTGPLGDPMAEEPALAGKVKCCSRWLRHQESVPRKNWSDGAVFHDRNSLEPWWSRTSVVNWLYQSSLVNPMQRWLERINEYADPLDPGWRPGAPSSPQRCVSQWLNLSKLSALVVSVSDR